MRYFFFTLILFSISPTCDAYEWLPEFHSLTESERNEFEGPLIMEPDYQSDILTYTKPLEWEYLWLTHPLTLDGSIGSISAKHFMLENRLKLRASLSEVTEFRFNYVEETSFEKDASHTILEFIFWPRKWLGLGIYGEPHFHKRNDDTGLALFIKPTTHHEIRIFNTFVDVARLRRSNIEETYHEPFLPYSRGIVGRTWQPLDEVKRKPMDIHKYGDFFEYALRYETKTKWELTEEDYIYEYWKLYGSLFGSKIINNVRFNARIQFDRKLESKGPIPGTTYAHDSRLNDRLLMTFQGIFFTSGPSNLWEIKTGVHIAYRNWKAKAGDVSSTDVLPHIWVRFPGANDGDREFSWHIGYNLNWHTAEGPAALRNNIDAKQVFDHRLNTVYEFNFGKKGAIRLVATFDLDKFGSRDTWEGGNGQFRFAF